jgi:hypothetical protein
MRPDYPKTVSGERTRSTSVMSRILKVSLGPTIQILGLNFIMYNINRSRPCIKDMKADISRKILQRKERVDLRHQFQELR